MIQKFLTEVRPLHDKHIKQGKSYWEVQKRKGAGGRPKKLESPQQLWELACDYFEFCDSTPWVKIEYKGKDLTRVEIPTSRPYTKGGLNEYLRSLGVIASLEDYRMNRGGNYSEFSEVIERVDNIIQTQKLEGAMVGAYNSRIVAYELGKADKEAGDTEEKKQVFIIGGQTIEI